MRILKLFTTIGAFSMRDFVQPREEVDSVMTMIDLM